MTLALEARPGEEIGSCVKTALRLAVVFDVDVEFVFNSFRVFVRSSDTIEQVLKRYQSNFKSVNAQ